MGVWIEICLHLLYLYHYTVTPLGGSVDWNIRPPLGAAQTRKSLPLVGVWIEIIIIGRLFLRHRSLPLVGVWIEIVPSPGGLNPAAVTPLGGSVDWNLKSQRTISIGNKSLPLVGVWIEIMTTTATNPLVESLPLVGVWIEIRETY